MYTCSPMLQFLCTLFIMIFSDTLFSMGHVTYNALAACLLWIFTCFCLHKVLSIKQQCFCASKFVGRKKGVNFLINRWAFFYKSTMHMFWLLCWLTWESKFSFLYSSVTHWKPCFTIIPIIHGFRLNIYVWLTLKFIFNF